MNFSEVGTITLWELTFFRESWDVDIGGRGGCSSFERGWPKTQDLILWLLLLLLGFYQLLGSQILQLDSIVSSCLPFLNQSAPSAACQFLRCLERGRWFVPIAPSLSYLFTLRDQASREFLDLMVCFDIVMVPMSRPWSIWTISVGSSSHIACRILAWSLWAFYIYRSLCWVSLMMPTLYFLSAWYLSIRLSYI